MTRLVATVVMLVVAATAVQDVSSQSSPSCEQATPLRGKHLPQIGPLVLGFYTVGPNKTGRVESALDPGYPTKAVLRLQPRRRLRFDLTLRGWNCRDGTRLRFWYGPSDLPIANGPYTTAQLRRIGARVQVLETSKYIEFRGYMLFTEAGLWRIAVYGKSRKIGGVVVLVGAR